MKITFLMGSPQEKKHSVRFDLEAVERLEVDGQEVTPLPPWTKSWKPSFYVPKPVGEKAERLRMTIEIA